MFKQSKVEVELNGITLSNRTDCILDDYSLTTNGINLTVPAQIGDVVMLTGYGIQGYINGSLYPMNVLTPRDNLYPSAGGCYTPEVETAPPAIIDLVASTTLYDGIQVFLRRLDP